MKILLSSGLAYKTHTLAEVEQLALSLGYDGLEIMPPPAHLPPNESDRDTNYASVTHAPVIHAIGDVYDQKRFRAALDASIPIAQTVNATIINIHPPSRTFGGRQNIVDGIAYLKEKERQTGLIMSWELLVDINGIHPDRRPYFVEHQAYASIEEYIDDVIKYDLAATIDTCHVGTWNEAPASLIKPLGNGLKHVHFSDFNKEEKTEHQIPGKGHVELKEFLVQLEKSRPDITLTVELNPAQTKDETVIKATESIVFIKQALGE